MRDSFVEHGSCPLEGRLPYKSLKNHRNLMKLNKIYFGICIALGAILGIITKNIPIWMCLGITLGLVLGREKK
jgi:hypothetical protein